ncbi:hypothetical protein [Streptomyces palmae]|uniref:Uncharacterized protein n=1 Tax=Streptomyces palmae TaxID=1701085 RepID=A0A4Z0HCG1_9ACTN|nr:hypothetical protein [Streptomyces palmae]TGB14594.1 hypothetical protein E4099_08125 [Streptomyces palmae]
MNEGDQNVTRIGGSHIPRGYRTFHGPVGVHPREDAIHVITFTGSEESDLLHAAGAWMAEHLDAVLLGMNWVADYLSPHDIDVPGPPRHRLDITVDLSNERR